MDDDIEVVVHEPEIEPLSSLGMDETEFTERLLDHMTGRKRWPVVVTLPVDILVHPRPDNVLPGPWERGP